MGNYCKKIIYENFTIACGFSRAKISQMSRDAYQFGLCEGGEIINKN